MRRAANMKVQRSVPGCVGACRTRLRARVNTRACWRFDFSPDRVCSVRLLDHDAEPEGVRAWRDNTAMLERASVYTRRLVLMRAFAPARSGVGGVRASPEDCTHMAAGRTGTDLRRVQPAGHIPKTYGPVQNVAGGS